LNALKKIKIALQGVCAFTLVALVIVLTMQIINRNFFGKSFTWAEELAGICMIYLTFLGSSLATLNNSNTRIDFFIRLLPEKGLKIMNIVSFAVSEMFLIVLGKYSFHGIVNNMKNLTPAMKLPIGMEYLGMFVGLLLMSAFYLIRIFMEIQSLKREEIEKEEEALK
jgi:TRAP-type C4-dicarboxylate transport system permease small subunit